MIISVICIFTNGMVLVFDEQEQQVPKFNGEIFTINWKKLKELCNENTKFRICEWGKQTIKGNISWIFVGKPDSESYNIAEESYDNT